MNKWKKNGKLILKWIGTKSNFNILKNDFNIKPIKLMSNRVYIKILNKNSFNFHFISINLLNVKFLNFDMKFKNKYFN